MTREIAHQKSFEKALFHPTELPAGHRRLYEQILRHVARRGDAEGPWNSGDAWEIVSGRDEQGAVDGGDGTATVKLAKKAAQAVTKAAHRLAHPHRSMTGAELGSGNRPTSNGPAKRGP
jgi:Mn-containing catalase